MSRLATVRQLVLGEMSRGTCLLLPDARIPLLGRQ